MFEYSGGPCDVIWGVGRRGGFRNRHRSNATHLTTHFLHWVKIKSFEVSKFIVSWFLSFKVSRIRKIHPICLRDIDPILPSCHFMSFNKCYPIFKMFKQIQFMFFWQILIPYSRFSTNSKTDLQNLSAPTFPKILKMLTFASSEISRINMVQINCVFSGMLADIWCLNH